MQFSRIKSDLAEHGYAIVRNFITDAEAQCHKEQLAQLVGLFGRDLVLLHSGMVQYIGHSRAQWELRHKSAPIFRELWSECNGGDDLITSFDGFCFMDGARNVKRVDMDSFLHRDQNLSSHEIKTYQGLVNLSQNLAQDTGGFVCVPKSHLLEDFGAVFPVREHTDQWYLFTDEEKAALGAAGWRAQFIPLQTGDFLLWDSRLLHCNTKCYDKSAQRVAVYICMVPRPPVSTAPAILKIMKARRLAATNKRCCRHYPLKHFKMFPEKPRFCTAGFLKKLQLAREKYELIQEDYRFV